MRTRRAPWWAPPRPPPSPVRRELRTRRVPAPPGARAASRDSSRARRLSRVFSHRPRRSRRGRVREALDEPRRAPTRAGADARIRLARARTSPRRRRRRARGNAPPPAPAPRRRRRRRRTDDARAHPAGEKTAGSSSMRSFSAGGGRRRAREPNARARRGASSANGEVRLASAAARGARRASADPPPPEPPNRPPGPRAWAA